MNLSVNSVIQRYMGGWKTGVAVEILDTLTEECLIIESHGPTYHGKKEVTKWIEEWHRQGNAVETWNMTSFHICGDLVVFEWFFSYSNKKNSKEAFEGVSLVKIRDNKIDTLREYRSLAK